MIRVYFHVPVVCINVVTRNKYAVEIISTSDLHHAHFIYSIIFVKKTDHGNE